MTIDPQTAQALFLAALELSDSAARRELLDRECGHDPALRQRVESLTIREKTQPDAWNTFNTQSMLGGALLGQKKFADAEPLLLKGYEGMKAREKTIPKVPQTATRLPEALERLVQLYTDWHATEPDKGYDAKATEWQQKLDEHNAALAAEKPPTTPDK